MYPGFPTQEQYLLPHSHPKLMLTPHKHLSLFSVFFCRTDPVFVAISMCRRMDRNIDLGRCGLSPRPALKRKKKRKKARFIFKEPTVVRCQPLFPLLWFIPSKASWIFFSFFTHRCLWDGQCTGRTNPLSSLVTFSSGCSCPHHACHNPITQTVFRSKGSFSTTAASGAQLGGGRMDGRDGNLVARKIRGERSKNWAT
ncbi:hypothetical protein VTK56DRAFT_8597 [Thermocarpiscus australiensis]